MKKISMSLLVFLLALESFGQNSERIGKIVDALTGEPVKDVTITTSTKIETVSNQQVFSKYKPM